MTTTPMSPALAGGLDCDAVRDALTGLALDEPLGASGRAVAAHAANCPQCDGFADDLATCRAGLLAPPRCAPPGPLAHSALEEQLRVRLARDLLARARRDAPRPFDELQWDLRRLGALAEARGAARTDARRIADALARPTPSRARLLGLAARLDPLGVDVALAWIGFLVHAGRRRQAERVADRLLRELPGIGP
jgi:hypothetical protein